MRKWPQTETGSRTGAFSLIERSDKACRHSDNGGMDDGSADNRGPTSTVLGVEPLPRLLIVSLHIMFKII